MLRYNEHTELVEIQPEALELPIVKELYLSDKIGDKSFFKKACKWVYHVYYRDHSLSNLPNKERKLIVIESYFNRKMPTNIDGNKRVTAFIDFYNFLQKGIEERLAETIKEAIAMEKEKITNLDTQIKEKVQIPYSFEHDFDLYEKNKDGNFRKLPKRIQTGTIIREIELNDSDILIKEVNKAFTLSKQYDEAVRRAEVERAELKVKYDGLSLLEKYHTMSSEQQKAYLKK